VQVLVTRPPEDAAPVVDELAMRGHTGVVSPMLTVRYLLADAPDLTGVQALLFTSANGVRAFAAVSGERGLPALTVGKATAAAAAEAGFVHRETAGGDADALVRLVAATRDPADGALFHAAGTVTTGDLAEKLDARGFTVRRTAVYAAEPATSLTAEAASALRTGRLDAVLFFSPRTAKTFVTLAHAADIADACRGVRAVCLSPAVANAAQALPWRDVHTAERPERAALLRTLDDLAGAAAPAPDQT
jgi:uroporphyrinogen-III synthase